MELHLRTCSVPQLAVRAVVIVLAGTGLTQPVATAGNAQTIARVRSTDPSLAALIDRATAQSATFRRLLATIERTNGIVQIEPGVCGHSVRACLKMWMESKASYRFLRVAIDRRNGDSDVEVMAWMGHELQHAIEALSESGVTDGTRLYNFFRRFAPTDGDRFETTAAIHAGDAVQDELSGR